MLFGEYPRFDATALATLVSIGEVSASELLDTAIAPVERLIPALNAVVQCQYEMARITIAASLLAGPFTGVRFLLKDFAINLADTPLTSGSRLFEGDSPDHAPTRTPACRTGLFGIRRGTGARAAGPRVTSPALCRSWTRRRSRADLYRFRVQLG
jgi:hypothetical protein